MTDFSTDLWYHYEFPLPEVDNAPVPSNADYSPKNVAWLMEMLAGIIGQSHTNIQFRYENNTPQNKLDDIFVSHPEDKLYWPENDACDMEMTPEMERYEMFAKESAILKEFELGSPAHIEYFRPLCKDQL